MSSVNINRIKTLGENVRAAQLALEEAIRAARDVDIYVGIDICYGDYDEKVIVLTVCYTPPVNKIIF